MNFPYILFAGDYNPDQWSEEIWLEDVRLMREVELKPLANAIIQSPAL